MTEWETVIGLEVHVELATTTKLFCGCPNHFGDEPNTNICPVCLGLPGSLPVLNRSAVDLAIQLGQALHCTVVPSIFHRKNYFYPDMPKDYQVSQYDQPVNVDGYLDLPSGARVGIERAHMEEDTGKSTHLGASGRIHGAGGSLVDYNRAGVPLVEIVSRPDLRSAEDARAYANELRAILLATGASDAKMEEGSMRVDANVSVRPIGTDAFGTRCEIKNLNSIRSLGRAIEYEAKRQIELLEAGERIIQQTRHWNEDEGRTHTLRSKEEADDYRYFPEPDLVPLAPDAEWIDAARASLPRLPAERRELLASLAGIPATSSSVRIAVERDLDQLAADAIHAGGDAARILVHVENDLGPIVGGIPPLPPEALAKLSQMEKTSAVTASQAKAIISDFAKYMTDDPAEVARAMGFEAMDTGALDSVVDEIIAAHPDEWQRYREGDDKARGKLTGFFVGEVMRATKGKADGKAVTARLRELAD